MIAFSLAFPAGRTARRSFRLATVALASALVVGSPLVAQSAQDYGVQVAFLSTAIRSGGSNIQGAGVEPQFRINRLYSTESFGALSLGIGGQWTQHSSGGDDLTITGVFLEPRWVPATSSTQFFPYLSARLALLRQSSNFGSGSGGSGFGAGGGLAVKLTKTINLDAGVQIVRQTFGEFTFNSGGGALVGEFEPFTTYAAKIGLSLGFPSR